MHQRILVGAFAFPNSWFGTLFCKDIRR